MNHYHCFCRSVSDGSAYCCGCNQLLHCVSFVLYGTTKITTTQKDLEPEYRKIVDDNFWDLVQVTK